jgi:MFS family permease
VTEIRARDLIAELDEASLSRFHLRAVLASGMGFFTDAYDLFVIGIASALITKDWTLSSGRLALLNSTMLFAAFIGAFVFGRFADVIGRKRVYWIVAAIMIAGALGSALSPSYWVLIGFRFLLGFGVGGDYPVSAVMVSEYANRKDRGKLVGMVFGTQALGLIVGPLIALALLGAGASNDTAWRVLLALGAVPAAAVIYLRCRMPESPRYQAQVQGKAEQAASRMSAFTGGQVSGNGSGGQVSGNGSGGLQQEMGLRAFLTNRRWLVMLAGTAGTWFLLDYAYYGNTISTPQILSPPGQDRAPAAAADRVRDDGAVLRRHRGGAGHDHRGRPVPAGVRGELLLHRVRPEHDDLRDAQRAVPGDHARDRARDLGGHRQARGVHRGLPVPGAADLAGAARHAAAHGGSGGGGFRPDAGPARAGRGQSGRNALRPAVGHPGAAGG